MERGLNLEALTEEDDEESWERSYDSSGDEGEDGFRGGEPNQFDNLCDGVLACMAIVHASLQELLDLKDELLRHSLPPSVLTKSALVTSKVFRSDMHVPIGELIRMVRLYSTPWEDKSTALKKLHDDYEGKKTQLNIAIKRLEFIDAQSKRIARERRVMNWEKLFAKLTAAKGHGRRWKFLIDAFKKRAGLGMEKLQEYLDSMDASSSEDEGEEEEEEAEVATQMQHVGMGSPSLNQEEEEDEPSSESDSSSDDEDESKDHKDSEIVSEVDSGPQQKHEEEVKKVVVIKPPMKDAEVWAGEPEFDHELHIRVFEPQGLDCRELKCVLNLGDAMWKTDVLDMNHEEEEVKPAPPKEEKKPPTTPKRGARGRGLIGARGSRVSPSKTPTLQMAPLPENEEEAPAEEEPKEKKKYYEECVFNLPEETPSGHLIPAGQSRVSLPEHLRVSVHFGPRDEIVAMATIHMTDLEDLELPTVVLDPPVGDAFDPEKALEEERERAEKAAKVASPENAINEVERANTELGNSSEGDAQEGDGQEGDGQEGEDPEDEGEGVKEPAEPEEEEKPKPKPKAFDEETEKHVNEMLGDRKAFDFPLYSIHSGKSDAVHLPCGALPLLCYWVKKERPRKLCKMTESESVNAIVLELTGIDLAVTTKEDLNKEMRDEALSTISFTPEPTEETVARAEYDRLMSAHNEEMEMLQSDYEQRLQELMDTIQQLQEAQMEMSAMAALPQALQVADPPPHTSPPHRVPSRSPARSLTPQRATHNTAQSPFEPYTRHSSADVPRPPSNKHTETEPAIYVQAERVPPPRVGKPLPKWGKHLSEDFFERLQQFEELSQQRRAELRDQILRGMSTDLEKKMASQYRLAHKHEEGLFDALQDVSLPAVFLPSKSTNMQIYNPRANKYFHPTGAGGARLAQPPSMLTLPPLPKSKMSVLNLFDVSQNFHRGGPDWLMQRYLSATAGATQEQTLNPPDTAPAATTQGQLEPKPPRSAPSQNQQQQPQQQARQPSARSANKSRQSGSGSSTSKRQSASLRQDQPLLSSNSVRHQVTMPGNTPNPTRSGTRLSAGSARQQGNGSVQGGSVMAGSAPPGSVMAGSVKPGSVPPGSAMAGSVMAGSVQPGSVMAESMPPGSVMAGSVPPGSVMAGSVHPGSVMAGSVQPGSVMAGMVSPTAQGHTPIQSVSPMDYVPPRSAVTLSATPGMICSPNPVGQQEAGLAGPMPAMRLVESGTPT